MSIENFWGDYEVGGAPAHHAKIKSVVSGKPETYTHAGQTESSEAYPNLSKQHFDAHSRRAQNFLLKHLLEAKHPGLKNIGGVPHVTLYRGVKGKYAESILEKFGAHKSHPVNPEIEAKRVSVKHLPAGSWSLEPEQARTFASTGSMDADGKVSPPRHGMVIKKDFPVSSVLHVGFGNWYPDKPSDAGQHYSEEEKEVVVHHPKERLVLSHNNLESIKVPGRDSFKKPGVVGADGQIKKSHPTPTFPKLGLGDDRRETPYVATPKAVKEKLHTVTASNALHPGNADLPREEILDQTKRVARKKFQDVLRNMTGTRGATTNAETGVQSGYALAGDFAPTDSQGDNQASVRGTKLHEDLHLMMNRVHKKYGAQGRQNLADNMYRAIPIQYRPAVDRYFEHKSGGIYKPHQITEEKLASVLNFMNSKTDRRAFHNSLNQLEDPAHEPQQFDQHMHRAYKAMLAAGGAADETWATHQKMFKSEDLEKGLLGDWQSEGYTIRHNGHMGLDVNDRKSKASSEITAHDSAGNQVGWLALGTDGDPKYYPMYGNVKIDPAHRRKGLASAMYAMAEKIHGKTIEPEHEHTSFAEAMWRQPNRGFGPAELPASKLTDKNPPTDPGALEVYNKTPHKYQKSEEPTKEYTLQHELWGENNGRMTVLAHHNGKEVGRADLDIHPSHIHVAGVHVEPAHRRKGVGSALLSHAEGVVGKRISLQDTITTPSSKPFWDKLGKSESDANPQDGIAHILHSSHDRHEKLLALKHRSVTPWDLKIALHDEDPVVREFAASHPAADESVKRYAAEQDNTEFAKNVPLLLFPKLGEHTAHSSPMFVSHTDFANKVKDGTAHNLGYTKASVRQQVQTPAEAQYLRAGVNVDAHKQKDPVARAKALNGTAQHEAQHMVFRRLDQRYGRQNATPKVLEHLYNGLDTDQKRAVATVFAAAKGPRAYAKESFKEEALTHLHQYLSDPGFRTKVHNNLGLDETAARDLQSSVKSAHQKLRTVAESLTPEHLGVISKSDPEILSEFSENLLKNHGNVNHDLVSDSLGVDLELAEYIKAVEFLTGKKLDEREVRRRMHTQDLSAAEAALDVAGANTEDARKSIEALVGIENVAKAEKDVQIQEFRPEGKEFADSVRQAYKYDQVDPVKLAGKHSSGALIVRDLDGNSLLLKPGSGNLSPAAGIRQENATQSRREGAFYAVADLLGLAQYLPKTELVSVGTTEYAVMDLLPVQYQNLFKQVKVDPGLARRVFEPYRIDGTLARWSALDWICSNVDRHGQNLMFAPNEHGGYDVKLIDHGSTFAGDQFNPGNDPDGKGGYNSFVPYYLRYGAPKGKFHQLDTHAKLRYMAQTPDDELPAFQQWLASIDQHQLADLLHSFGISHEAVRDRLEILKAAAAYGFEAVNRLWIIGKPVSAPNSPSETP